MSVLESHPPGCSACDRLLLTRESIAEVDQRGVHLAPAESPVMDLAVLATVVFSSGLMSRRLEGTVLTAPIVFGAAAPGLVEFAPRLDEMDGSAPERRETVEEPTRAGAESTSDSMAKMRSDATSRWKEPDP